MTRYILRRLIAMPFLVLGIVTLAFLLTTVTKGDPLTAIVSDRQMNDPEAVAAAKARWGLDRSLPERYLIYVGNLLTGDMGTSFITRRPVAQDVLFRLPATMELVLAAMIVGSTIGITLGVLAAYFRNTAIDHAARFFALFGSSIPVFWLGLALLYVFSVEWGVLPGPGRVDPRVTPPASITGLHDHRFVARRQCQALPRCVVAPDPARLRARLGGCRHYLPAGARQHARGARPRVHPDGARQGGGRASRRGRPCAAQHAGADADRHRLSRSPTCSPARC